MAIVAGERAGRGVRAPQLPTPTLPSFRGAACADRSAARDWRTALQDNPLHQRFLTKTYCDHCPIAELCLQQALERGESTGVWGGLTADEFERAVALKNDRVLGKKTPAPAAADESVSEPAALGVAA